MRLAQNNRKRLIEEKKHLWVANAFHKSLPAWLDRKHRGASSSVQHSGAAMGRILCLRYQVRKQWGSVSALHKDAAGMNSALVVAEAKIERLCTYYSCSCQDSRQYSSCSTAGSALFWTQCADFSLKHTSKKEISEITAYISYESAETSGSFSIVFKGCC